MEQECVCCPICTLYLREGISLQAHLETHPKDKVIEALLKATNPNSILQTSQPSGEPEESSGEANSVVEAPTASNGNSQTQVSSSVAYQQFATTNTSTVIPQYIQVVAPNSNTSIVPNPTITFMPPPHPHPHTPSYVHSIYNPLYNAYIPPPYPLVQPIYTNMPFSSDFNPLMSTSQVTTPVIASSTSQGDVNGRPNPVANNTGPDTVPARKKSKKLQSRSRLRSILSLRLRSILGSRFYSRLRPLGRRNITMKKHLSLRRKATASTSAASTSAASTSAATTSTTSTSETSAAKTPVVAEGKSLWFNNDLMSLEPPISSSASVITQLPVTLGATLASTSSPESSCLDLCLFPRRSAPFYSTPVVERTRMDLEAERYNARTEAVKQSNNRNDSNVREYFANTKRSVSLRLRTQGNSSAAQCANNIIGNCNMYEDISDCDSRNGSFIPLMPFYEEPLPLVCEKRSEVSQSVCGNFERGYDFVNEQDRWGDYEEEIPDRVFHSFSMESEKNVAFTFNVENQEENEEENYVNRYDMFEASDVFQSDEDMPSGDRGFEGHANESELIDYAAQTGMEADNTTPGVQKVSSVIFLGNSSGSNVITPSTERLPQVEREGEFVEMTDITYTDLQPATGKNSLMENLEIAASLHLNNYMEVDGVKIFFNAGSIQTTPLEPVVKFSTPNTDVSKVQNFLKPENGKENSLESVIHLVPGTTPRGDSSGETFHGSNSENSAEMRNISPASLNIRADESMPARGELSEQESLGTENSTWTLFHCEIKKESDIMSGNEFRGTILDIEDFDEVGKSVKCSFLQETSSCVKNENLNEDKAYSRVKKEESQEEHACKSKIFSCSQCKIEFSSFRAKKNHVTQNHFDDLDKDQKVTSGNKKRKESKMKLKKKSADGQIEDEAAAESESSDKNATCEVTRVCPNCHLQFVGTKKLKEHLKEVHNESKFKCGTCSEIFETQKEFNAHLKVHPLKCEHCGKLFHRKQSIKLHIKRHWTVRPFKCTNCPKTFVTRQKMEEHVNGHIGLKPLKCSSCDCTFSRFSNLVQHKKVHHHAKKKERDFVCRCGEVFHSARKLAWHKEVHDTKPKTCPYCSQKFIHKNSVTRHIRRSHMPEYLPKDKQDTENVRCPVCGKIYLKNSLPVHMRVHDGLRPHICKICNKSFTTKWNLELHNWTHQSRSSMPFKCPNCKSAFYRQVDYIAHLNSHKNLRPFTCNICGQKFIRKYNCLRHQQEHKKEKRFACSVPGCDKSFHRSYYLRDHLRIHSGLRPHTCHICGKSSSTKSNHNKHIRIHDTREQLNTEN